MPQRLRQATFKRNSDGSLTLVGRKLIGPVMEIPDYYDPICDVILKRMKEEGVLNDALVAKEKDRPELLPRPVA